MIKEIVSTQLYFITQFNLLSVLRRDEIWEYLDLSV